MDCGGMNVSVGLQGIEIADYHYPSVGATVIPTVTRSCEQEEY